MSKISLGFVPEPKTIAIDKILPSRRAPTGIAASRKYKQVLSSIQEVGLIEPLTIAPTSSAEGPFTLLDGHVRLMALRELGHQEVPCLTAIDDEAYTYNNRLNRLSSIQEHFMIRRAIERGVSPERLAKALSLDVSHIQKKHRLLDGLCPEVISLLEDRQFSAEFARMIKKMKPTRQVECVELMISANNMTTSYAEALLAATPADLLVENVKPKRIRGVTREHMARMEREMNSLHGQYRLVEQSYGQDVLSLVLVRGYLVKLIGNAAVAKFLHNKVPEIMEQFEAIAATASMDG